MAFTQVEVAVEVMQTVLMPQLILEVVGVDLAGRMTALEVQVALAS
jgi:hypothetical protein|tara:strand:+ start:267 stop:404 length:138 start_codon:yes stop_codon:yes gene_type:complete